MVHFPSILGFKRRAATAEPAIALVPIVYTDTAGRLPPVSRTRESREWGLPVFGNRIMNVCRSRVYCRTDHCCSDPGNAAALEPPELRCIILFINIIAVQ